MSRLICCILGFACFPSQVWAAPKAIHDLLPAVHEAITFSQEAMPEHADASGDHDVPHIYGGHRFEVSGTPAPVAGQGMPCAEDACLVRCTSFVVAPFFQPEVVSFELQLPCEESDVVRATQRNLQHLALEYSDAIAPAYPQPCQDCQTMIVYPEWASFAGLTAIVLDLRLSPLSGNGPIIAAFVTRPTNLAELRREAGIYAVRTCNVFASSSPDALEDNELIYLDHGALVRFVPVEQEPLSLSRLYPRLQHKDAWEAEQSVPAIPRAGSLMLLHTKGRFIFSRVQTPGQSLDAAAAEFVGVQRTSVSYHSPRDGECERFSHRGNHLRGILAMADRERTQLGHIVIFLDLRQVAAAIQFVTLPSNELTYDQLDGLLPRRPPHGWRLVVKGGRRHSEHLVVQHGETLQVGFIHASVLVPDFDSGSSFGGSDDEDEESEDGEGDPTSNASTRSRSLRRGPSPTKPEPSSDHSYGPGPLHDNSHKLHGTAFFHAWCIPDVVSDTLCDGQPWALFEDLPNLVSTDQACKVLSYVGCTIDHRVPDVGSGHITHFEGNGRDGRGWQELGLPPEERGPHGTDPPEFQNQTTDRSRPAAASHRHYGNLPHLRL